jgi:hypothetical protein
MGRRAEMWRVYPDGHEELAAYYTAENGDWRPVHGSGS